MPEENQEKSTGGVKVYDRPDTAPSKAKAISIIVSLLLLIVIAVIAYYVIF